MIRNILVAVELGAADSEAAVDLAATLAVAHGAILTLLHVASPPSSLSGLVPGANANDVATELGQARAALASLALTLTGKGVSIVTDVEAGYAAEAILRRAHRDGSDVIVIGTHGRKGLPRLLVGSVSAEVMAKAACQVVIVHAAH